MSGMALTPGDGPNRNPVPRNDQRAPDVYVNGRGSRTLVPSRPVSPGQQGQQQPGQYPGQRPGERPSQGQGPGYGSGPHSPPGGDGRDPYGQGGYGDQGYGGQNGYDGRNGWDGRNGYDGRNGQPGQQGRNGSGRDRDDAPKRKKKQQSSAKRRKQLGSDRRTKALPMVPKPVSDGRVAMGRLAIIVTVSAWIAYTVNWFFADFFHPGNESAIARTEEVLYLLIVTLLTASAMAYLLSRLGFFYRTRTHHRATRGSLDQYFDTKRPTLTTIIPSYQEEERVIMATLLTAALQEYPDKSVVLLIDDPYVPKNAKAREQLENARALPAKVERILAEPARRFAGGMTSLEIALRRGEIPGHTAMLAVASAYADAIQWLEDFAADQEIVDHTDTFFVNGILLKLAESFREVRTAVALGAARPGGAW